MDADTDSPNLPEVLPSRKDTPEPGHDLDPKQRELIELVASENVSGAEAARRCAVPVRTGQSWLVLPAGRRYLDFLVDHAVSQAQTRIRNTFAQRAPAIAERVSDMAEGKGRHGKPAHPYQHFYAGMVLDRLAPRPAPAQAEVGIKVPTEQGDIIIVWRSRARYEGDT